MRLTKEKIEVLMKVKEDGANFNFDSRSAAIVNKLEQMGLVKTTFIHGQKEPYLCKITDIGKETLKQEGII